VTQVSRLGNLLVSLFTPCDVNNFCDAVFRLDPLWWRQTLAASKADADDLDPNETFYPALGHRSGGCARLWGANGKIRRAR